MAKQLASSTIKGLNHPQSPCGLPEPQGVKGSDFAEMLRAVGYPGAEYLKHEDFDWFCEGNEAQELVGLICKMVDQCNVLSREPLGYDLHLGSGQTTLKGENLENLCKGDNMRDEEWEDRSIELQEAVFRLLRALEVRFVKDRIQVLCLGLTVLSNHLSLDKSKEDLTDMKERLLTLKSDCNSLPVKELWQDHSQSAENALLSSLDLNGYMRAKDKCLEQVEENAKSVAC